MTHKKLTSLISALAIAASISTITVYAGEEYVDDDGTVYCYLNSEITDIIPGEGVETLNIPGEIGGREVFSIRVGKGQKAVEENITEINLGDGVNPKGDFTFGNFKSLERISLPYGLESISDMAFLGLENLENVSIPESINKIGDGSFMNCTSLKSISIPDSVTVIGDSAFSGCTSLKEVNWNGLAELNDNAFEGTPYFENYPGDFILTDNGKTIYMVSGSAGDTVEIPETVTNIRQYAFKNSKVKKVIWSENLDTIGQNVFYGATNLKDVEFNGKIKKIEMCAFQGCTSLTKPIIPEGITEIPWGCFSYCSGIKTAEIPENIKKIDQYAFAYNDNLSGLKLNEGLETIEANAFELCTSLKEVIIPPTVKKIGERAFNDCKALSRLEIKGAATIEKASFCGTKLEEKNVILANGIVYEPVAENKKYEDDPLEFLYEKNAEIEKEPVYATHKPFETETPTRATAEPEETEIPKATQKPEATLEPDNAPILEVSNQNGEIEVNVEDEKVIFTDAKPFIDENDRTQIPVRAVAEMLGFDVDYEDGTVTLQNGERKITLCIGKEDIVVDYGYGVEISRMDTTARIVNDRTYVPIRYVGEMLGYAVEWK